MSGHTKVDMAKPAIPKAKTPEEMVTEGNALQTNVKAGVHYQVATGVQVALADYGAALALLDGNNKAKDKAKQDLSTAETNEPTLVRRVDVRRRAVANAIELFADGSKDVTTSFNVPLEEKHAQPEAITPLDLRPMKVKKANSAGCRWNPTPGAHGYGLQHATNPADPTTYSAEIAVPAARFWLPLQTVGTTVYFRVLACDAALPNGKTAYSAWVAVVVT